jgi:hypothetical protein
MRASVVSYFLHECVDVPVLVRRWKAILSFDFFIGDWALSAAYG